jgi:hypothetical protein
MKLKFSELSPANLKSIVTLREKGVTPARWAQMAAPASDEEQARLKILTAYLLNYPLSLMNEATIWARAIYPLLMLAERGPIQAWAQTPLRAAYPRFELEGTVDGVLGNCVSGTIETPYLIVVEAKRGLEAQNPQAQLYGEMLAAARLNQQESGQAEQEIFGCYTISDTWTFVYGLVHDFEADYPTLTVESSREYVEKIEAETIFQILKAIVGRYYDHHKK